jgi:hypothetical protein
MKPTLALVTALLLASLSSTDAAEYNPVWKRLKFGIFTLNAWGGTAYALTEEGEGKP